MNPIQPLGKIVLLPCLQDSQQPFLVSKTGHFLAGPGPSGYVGTSRRAELSQIVKYCMLSLMASPGLCSYPQDIFQSQTQTPFAIFSKSQLSRSLQSTIPTALMLIITSRWRLHVCYKQIGLTMIISIRNGVTVQKKTIFSKNVHHSLVDSIFKTCPLPLRFSF